MNKDDYEVLVIYADGSEEYVECKSYADAQITYKPTELTDEQRKIAEEKLLGEVWHITRDEILNTIDKT